MSNDTTRKKRKATSARRKKKNRERELAQQEKMQEEVLKNQETRASSADAKLSDKAAVAVTKVVGVEKAGFLRGTLDELNRVTWPGTAEVIAGTAVTMLVLFISSGFLSGMSWIFHKLY